MNGIKLKFRRHREERTVIENSWSKLTVYVSHDAFDKKTLNAEYKLKVTTRKCKYYGTVDTHKS